MKLRTALIVVAILLLSISFLGCPGQMYDGPRRIHLDMSLDHVYSEPAKFGVWTNGSYEESSFQIDNVLVILDQQQYYHEVELEGGRFHAIEWRWDGGHLLDTLDLGFEGKPMLRVNDLPIEVGTEVRLPGAESYRFVIEIPQSGHSPVPVSWPTSYDNQLILNWRVNGQQLTDVVTLPIDKFERTFDNLTALDNVQLQMTKRLNHDLLGYGEINHAKAHFYIRFLGLIEYDQTEFTLDIL